MIAPARLRGQVLAAMRAAHPYEEPAFDVLALAALPAGVGIGRIGSLAEPMRLADFVARVNAVLPQTTWGVRAAGDPDAVVSRVAVCGGAGDSLLGAASRGRGGRLRHRRPAAPSRRRAPAGQRRRPGRRRALGQ